MNDYFYDESGQLVYYHEVGPGLVGPRETISKPVTRPVSSYRASTFRKAAGASPGWLDDLKAQLKKVPTWAWITGGAGLVLLLVVTKGEKSDWLKKI